MEGLPLMGDGQRREPKPSFSLVEKLILGAIGLFFVGLVVAFVTMMTIDNGLPKKDSSDKALSYLLGNITASGAQKTMKDLSYSPHIAGSEENKAAAQYLYDLYESFGLEVWNESFPALINYPGRRVVELLSPTYFNATMEEELVNDGTDPAQAAKAIPTFNGYSAAGNVTAPLVYVNYGRREDYETLESLKVSVAGRIVIVRYGKVFRGDKCAQAQELGAVGCFIYSDPADDGFVRAESVGSTVYPIGPWRTNTSVQRGSVWTGNGDPATPGYPSTKNAPRLSYNETQDPVLSKGFALPTIPIQPLSWSDAEPLLRALGGPAVPAGWQGGLNFTYHIGPGDSMVHFELEMNYTTATIWNVYAKIVGSEEPDRIVFVGAHRDAWTFGAGDPLSGTASVGEVARGFGALAKSGLWKPRRTIIFCSWDAEEYGLIGSFEFNELHEKTIMQRAVAYFNFDIAVMGTELFIPLGVPTLHEALIAATNKVKTPGNDSRTVFDMWVDNKIDSAGVPVLQAPGAGSDFAGFIQLNGVPVAHLQMHNALSKSGAEPYLAVYHSNYDSYYWFDQFDDKAFKFHAAQAQVMALLAKDFLDSPILPLNYTDYAAALRIGVSALMSRANKLNDGTHNITQMFTPLMHSVDQFAAAAAKMHSDCKAALNKKDASPLALRALNDRLLMAERAFIDFNGIPGRTILRHVVWAPSAFDSYAGEVFPTISDALSEGVWSDVEKQVNYVTIFVDASSSILRGDTL